MNVTDFLLEKLRSGEEPGPAGYDRMLQQAARQRAPVEPDAFTGSSGMPLPIVRGAEKTARGIAANVEPYIQGQRLADPTGIQAMLQDKLREGQGDKEFARLYSGGRISPIPEPRVPELSQGPFAQEQPLSSVPGMISAAVSPENAIPMGGSLAAVKQAAKRLGSGALRMGERIADRVMVPSPGDAAKVKAGALGAGAAGTAGYSEPAEPALTPATKISKPIEYVLERLRHGEGRTGDVSSVMMDIQQQNLDPRVIATRDDLMRSSPEFSQAAPYLMPQQLSRAVKNPGATAERYAQDWPTLPSVSELTTIARAGEPARGWYKGARSTIGTMFPDPNEQSRFAYGMASLSPQLPVEGNARNMVPSYFAWKKAGMPTDDESIHRILAENVQSLPILSQGSDAQRSLAQLRTLANALGAPPEVINKNPMALRLALSVYEQSGPEAAMDVLKNSVLEAWRGNFGRAMRDERLISGPKVHSFGTNLDPQNKFAGLHFTGDTWDAMLKGWHQKERYGGQGFNVPRHDPGYSPGYSMSSAKTGQVADQLGWLPEEVQETNWSWTKPIGEGYPFLQVSPNKLRNVPTFQDLLRQPEFLERMPGDVRSRLENAAGPTRSSSIMIPNERELRQMASARRRIERIQAERSARKLGEDE